MAIYNPCKLASNPSNTGSECSDAMKSTAMIFMVPKSDKWTDADITTAGSLTAFILTKVHAAASARWYPIFGRNTPIRNMTDSTESDVIEQQEDGSRSFIRYGYYNRTFVTTEGGICLAQHLMSFRGFNYAFIEVDITGQVTWMKNSDGSYSGFPTALAYPPSAMLATLKTAYKNQFMLSFNPMDYIKKGVIVGTDDTEDLMGISGLLDSAVTTGTQTQTTTNIYVGAKTVCAETDLAALYTGTGAGKIAQITNFVITKADGTVITPTAAAMQNGEVKLTGTYLSGTTYYVAFAAPATLKANGIIGYEGIVKATIVIP